MNRKGFTLIELLAIIVLIGILVVFVIPAALTAVEEGKNSSYNILLKNIVTASQTYYEECEYGDLSDKIKYNNYACEINSNTINTTLGALANTGFLSVNNTKVEDGKEVRVVIDPNTDKDISSCKVKITKEVSSNYKVTYKIENNDLNTICPTAYE